MSDQAESCKSDSRKAILIILMGVLGLASMFLCLFVLSGSQTYRVTAQLIVPSERAETCIELIQSDSGVSYEKMLLTPSVVVIQLARETSDRQTAQLNLDALSSRIIDMMATAVTTQPVSDERIVQLEAKLRELNLPLTKGGQGGVGTAVDIHSLVNAWRQQIANRQTLTSQLKELDTKLTTKSPTDANVIV